MRTKQLFLIISLLFGAQTLLAQEHKPDYDHVRLVELEIGVGLNKAHAMEGHAAKIGEQFYIEPRVNLPHSAFDIGLQFSMSRFKRKADSWSDADAVTSRGTIVAGADYNFRKWAKTSLFVGVGIGVAFLDSEHSYYIRSNGSEKIYNDTLPLLNPRIGVEFFSHLRLTLEYKWICKPYSYFGLNIGGVFGGGAKQ